MSDEAAREANPEEWAAMLIEQRSKTEDDLRPFSTLLANALRNAMKRGAKDEREACAAIADAAAEKSSGWGYEEEAERIRQIAAALRARDNGEKG